MPSPLARCRPGQRDQHIRYIEFLRQLVPVKRRVSVEQGQEGNLLSGRVKLPRHFVSDETTERETTEQVWTNRLHFSHGLDITSRHLLNLRIFLSNFVQRRRLQTIKRLIVAEVAGQKIVIIDISSKGMHAEETRFRSQRLNRNQRRPTPGTTLFAQSPRQLLNSLIVKEG